MLTNKLIAKVAASILVIGALSAADALESLVQVQSVETPPEVIAEGGCGVVGGEFTSPAQAGTPITKVRKIGANRFRTLFMVVS